MSLFRALIGYTAAAACLSIGSLTGGSFAVASVKQAATPHIVNASFAETYFDPTASKRAYTLVSILFRTCTTDPPQRLTVTVSQTLSSGSVVKAAETNFFDMPKSYVQTKGCVVYRTGWKEKAKFMGTESYFVGVQVRSGNGSVSNIVKRQFIHGS
jgi:hypothetical protein